MLSNNQLTILAADIGATKTNMALFSYDGSEFHVLKEQTFLTSEYQDLVMMIFEFLPENTLPDRIGLGAAGPVIEGSVKFTNLTLNINAKRISEHVSNIPVLLINDLEATAYGLATLKENDLETITTGAKAHPGNMAVIAPGTGLGEAGLYWDGRLHHPFSTEGGHCDFSPRTHTDYELLKYLQQDLGVEHISWERLLSGAGIYNLFRFLRDVDNEDDADKLTEQLLTSDPAAVISKNAADHPICSKAMELFFRYLAHEAANLALKVKSTGGLFIAGGIVKKNRHLLNKETFFRHFCDKGRLEPLLRDIPVAVVLNEKAPLLGAAYHAANV